jgi:trigger factor
MSVVLAMEEVGPCRLQLEVEVPVPVVEAEEQRVTQEYARRAKIPGFRKGKVPAAMVRRHFGDEIRREVIDRLLPRYWKQAAAEKSLDPLGPPSVTDVRHEAGAPLAFKAVVEVRPEIELRNYRDLALPEPPVEPTADEIGALIDQLRRSHAEWVPVERAAATGDRVEVEVVERGRQPVDGESRTAEIEVGSERVWEELSLAVTGLAAGQGGSFDRRLGEGEEARQATFDVRVLEVREAKLPAADDELAKHFGEFESFAAFEADVARRLRQSKLEESREQRERALLDQLTERHPLTLPEGVVRHEVEALLREYAEGLARRGVDLEKAEIDWQKIGEEARPHAERRVKARLLLDAIAEAERIAVSAEEFEQALFLLARLQGVASGALRQRLDEAGELSGFRARMRREKAVRYLLGESETAAAAEPTPGPSAE